MGVTWNNVFTHLPEQEAEHGQENLQEWER